MADAIVTDDIVVTATRTEVERKNVISDITVITSAELKRNSSNNIIDILQQQPGIEIHNTGGLGKTSSIFLRGTNANSVVVLIDGVRINSATAGITSWENIPTSQIDRIEILRGPSSSLYGADAIGGVIQIFTKKGIDGFHPYIGGGIGSNNTKTGQIGVRGSNTAIDYSFNLSTVTTKGMSAFDTSIGNVSDRDGYDNVAVTGSLGFSIDANNRVDFNLFRSEGNNEYDNRWSDYNMSNKVINQSVGVTLTTKFTDMWTSRLQVAQGKDEYIDNQVYDADIWDYVRGQDNYVTTQDQYSWQNDYIIGPGTATILIDRLEQNIKSDTAYTESSRNNTGYMIGYQSQLDQHSFQTTYRVDDNSQFGVKQTGGVGYGYQLLPKLKFVTSLGTAYRVPTFNDLYYPGVGASNLNLVPETSKNIEAGVRYQDNENSLGVTVFKNEIKDLIVLDENWTPQNTNRAKITGVTWDANYWVDHTQFKASYTIQNAKDETSDLYLVRRAKNYGSVQIAHYVNQWSFGTEIVGSGSRYNDANNTVTLDGYILSNIFANIYWTEQLTVNARINNVFDKDYTLAKEGNYNYTTDGINATLNFVYEF